MVQFMVEITTTAVVVGDGSLMIKKIRLACIAIVSVGFISGAVAPLAGADQGTQTDPKKGWVHVFSDDNSVLKRCDGKNLIYEYLGLESGNISVVSNDPTCR